MKKNVGSIVIIVILLLAVIACCVGTLLSHNNLYLGLMLLLLGLQQLTLYLATSAEGRKKNIFLLISSILVFSCGIFVFLVKLLSSR